MNADLTNPDTQVRLLIAEFVITLGALEAEKARLIQTTEALLQEKADLIAQLAKAVAAQEIGR